MTSISFAIESLMDPRIQVKLDKYQKCGNIISQTSLLSSYTGSETYIYIYIYKDINQKTVLNGKFSLYKFIYISLWLHA